MNKFTNKLVDKKPQSLIGNQIHVLDKGKQNEFNTVKTLSLLSLNDSLLSAKTGTDNKINRLDMTKHVGLYQQQAA